MIPIHPQDQLQWLLGIQWKGAVYVDRMLPFSLRSAQNIFGSSWRTTMDNLNQGNHSQLTLLR